MAKWIRRPGEYYICANPSDITAGLMRSRGIDPSDETFSTASLSSLSDQSVLGIGASVAADIILDCKGKNIAVIGDYDADGVVSSSVIKRTVELLGGNCSVFLPSRWIHGYGLNDKTVSAFLTRFSGRIPDYLFVVDCGSSSEQHIVKLKEHGIKKVVVIDHHIVDPRNESKSADAHINWRLHGNSQNLCASGEVFQVARLAMTRAGMDWEWMLPFVAIATVGDAVPIIGDNRVIVKQGADIGRMSAPSLGSPGLALLATQRCRGGVSQKTLSFNIVPRINAAGRVGEPDIVVDFLLERNEDHAAKLLAFIEAANDERKVIQDDIFRKGIKMLGGQEAKPSEIFLHSPEWNIGVCGISCSQMVEKYGVPTMMFGTYGGKIKGSGRSIPGINIKAVLDACGEDVFERYGGHEMACGAVIRGGMFNEARERFKAALAKVAMNKPIQHTLEYDTELPIEQITKELGNSLLETLYPYCPAENPEPVFKISSATAKSICLTELKSHMKMDIIIEKDGKSLPIRMSSFFKTGIDDAQLALAEGDVADFYFSFPQTYWADYNFIRTDEYCLELIDFERK
jgi:single-stranded-DNA-specific exonuclease